MTNLLDDLAEVRRLIDAGALEAIDAVDDFIRDHAAEIDRNARDAERYRWIRGKRSGEELVLVMNYELDDLDQAIDDAMRGGGE